MSAIWRLFVSYNFRCYMHYALFLLPLCNTWCKESNDISILACGTLLHFSIRYPNLVDWIQLLIFTGNWCPRFRRVETRKYRCSSFYCNLGVHGGYTSIRNQSFRIHKTEQNKPAFTTCNKTPHQHCQQFSSVGFVHNLHDGQVHTFRRKKKIHQKGSV